MAHSAIHFSLGVVIGSLAAARPIPAAWRRRERLSGHLLRWLLVGYGTGILAIVPSLLGYLGIPESVCQGWWMNIFVLHPLLNRLIRGGTIIGTFLLVALPTCQYALILAVLRRKLHERRPRTPKWEP